MDTAKRDMLKIWALQSGYSNITELAKASGLSRNSIYNAIKYKPGDRSLGEQGLKKLAEVLDLTYNTILDWYEGRF